MSEDYRDIIRSLAWCPQRPPVRPIHFAGGQTHCACGTDLHCTPSIFVGTDGAWCAACRPPPTPANK